LPTCKLAAAVTAICKNTAVRNLGYRSGVAEGIILLFNDAASVSDVSGQSSVSSSTTKDATATFSRNVGKKLCSDMVSYPRRTEKENTVLGFGCDSNLHTALF